jgi:poly(3-hydroxybutyrate) depolymerase
MYNLTVGSMQRMFIIKLPAGYDANKPYKLVFTWHPLGSSAQAIASSGYYGLDAMSAGSAIFVSPEGLAVDAEGRKGWANSGGQDVAFAKSMVEKFKTDYCLDTGRIFSTGFSYGAIMSNTVGCAMGDVFRAIAPMSGSGPRGTCTGGVAVWMSHGEKDQMSGVTYANGQASRDFWIKANGCTTPGPADANGCVTYQGCKADSPLVWCSIPNDAHTPPRIGPAGTWKFFSQF